ncbi:MAG: 16S rRNA (adenine(1518)-N(6)/adenine(1519)-N(6))-dimethyltransferase RsmA [Planctomycetota bacterium]
MPQTKREIEAVLQQADMRPRHRFGQNFMIEPDLVRLIADAGQLEPGDHVIEVGPGTGTLTDELLDRGAKVLAVEIDRDLAAAARDRLGDRVEVVEGDAMTGKHELHPTVAEAAHAGAKLVANLPYNIASPLVIELLIAGSPLLVFTVQKEVADRLRATPSDGKAYGPLSVVAQSLSDVEVLRVIPPTAFHPRPTIDSALVRLRHRIQVDGDLAAFSRFVSALFGQRRKSIRNPLKAIVGDRVDDVLAAAGLTGSERAGELGPDIVHRLHGVAQPLR